MNWKTRLPSMRQPILLEFLKIASPSVAPSNEYFSISHRSRALRAPNIEVKTQMHTSC